MKRLCVYPCCPSYRLEGSSYCRKHDYLRVEKEQRQLERFNNRFSKYGRSSELYRTSRWRNERIQFLRDNPYCQYCGSQAEVVDHVRPHRGNEELFWDKDNWQSLCKPCHEEKTRKEIAERRHTGSAEKIGV